TQMRHLGIAEVPHLIALGAYLGDERLIDSRDFDRDCGRWAWPASGSTLTTKIEGLPREVITLPGDVVVRVEITYPILDEDVAQVVSPNRLADVRIQVEGRIPAPGLVKTASDAHVIRLALREALTTLATVRPHIEVIHLFVAAPVSVCVGVGQELRL